MSEEKTGKENNSPKGQPDLNFLRYTSTAALANFVQPIFTLFVTLLALELGADPLEIGLVGGASSFVYTFMPFVMGRFSDRGEARKFFIIISLALLSTVSILYSFAQNPVILILLRTTEGLGWAIFWPSIDSAVTHDTKMDPRRALSIFNLSWSLTAALGPLVGSLVILVSSIRFVFVFDALFLLAGLSVNLVTYFRGTGNSIRSSSSGATNLPDGKTEEIVQTSASRVTPTAGTATRISPFFYVFSLVLCTIASSTLSSFLSPYAKSQGIPIFVIGAVAFTYGIMRFTGYLLTTSGSVRRFLLNDRTRTRNIMIALSIEALSTLLMLIHDKSAVVYFISFGLVGLCYSVVYSVAMVAFLAETSKEKMGLGAGIFENSIGIGAFAGPVVAGIISGNSLTVPFIVPSLSAIPILSYLFFLSRSGRSAAKNQENL